MSKARHRKPSSTSKTAATVAVALTMTGTGTAVAATPPGGPRTEELPIQTTALIENLPVSTGSHTVVPGDTLSEIAETQVFDWKSLYEANKDVVKDPDLIYPGQVLDFPSGAAPVTPPAPAAAMTVAPKEKPSAEPVKAATPSVVSAAQTYLGRGIQYVWGGKSVSQGFDCSGFVWQALKDAGYNVPYRTSGALKAWATPISASEARPGDLVFWPGHVEIYVGNGKTIGAANPKIDIGIHAIHGNPTYGRIPI